MELWWLGVFIVLLIIEIFTLGLTTIWFAGGALIAFIAAEFGLPLPVQIALFFAVSLVLLIFTRPVAVKYFNARRTKTNSDSLVGETALVTMDIDNSLGKGQAIVNGLEWTARAENPDTRIAAGRQVIITSIDGVKLIVKEENE